MTVGIKTFIKSFVSSNYLCLIRNPEDSRFKISQVSIMKKKNDPIKKLNWSTIPPVKKNKNKIH